MTNNPVQIIYLNGPSSSGKNTLAKALQHSFEDLFLHVGIDKIIVEGDFKKLYNHVDWFKCLLVWFRRGKEEFLGGLIH